MDIGINPESWGQGQTGDMEPGLAWQGLRARFMAGYAMRDALSVQPKKGSGGSFNRESARILSGYANTQPTGLAPVNPSALADGNSPNGKNKPVAGNKRPTIEE